MTRNIAEHDTPKRAPEARQRKVIEVAARLFAEHGFAQTSTARIAREAGVAEGTLFHYFPTKRALLARVGEQEAGRVLAIAFEGVDPSGPPPPMELLVRRLFAYAKREPARYRLFAMNGDVEDLNAGFAAKESQVVTGIASALAGWSARGHLRHLDPDVVARLAFAVVDAGVRILVLEERWQQEEAVILETTRALNGILFGQTTWPDRPDP